MIRLTRWLFGYVEFCFSGGFYEGFLNECYKKALPVRKIALCDDGFVAYCNIRCYKKLHKIALHHGGKVRITGKYGLPFYLTPLKNRAGLAIGAVLFVFIISFLGSFVWNIEIVGNDKITTAQISAYLDKNGLKTGVMWSSFDKKALAIEMMRDFDETSWVHINKIGTTARVEINETVNKPVPDSSALRGETVFRKELEVTTSRTQSKIHIKKTKDYYNLRFFSLNIPLYINKTASDFESIETRMIKFNDITLPIGYTVTSEKWLDCEKYDLTDEQLLDLSKKKLALLEQSELDGFEIVNKSLTKDINDTTCTITGSYIVRVKE